MTQSSQISETLEEYFKESDKFLEGYLSAYEKEPGLRPGQYLARQREKLYEGKFYEVHDNLNLARDAEPVLVPVSYFQKHDAVDDILPVSDAEKEWRKKHHRGFVLLAEENARDVSLVSSQALCEGRRQDIQIYLKDFRKNYRKALQCKVRYTATAAQHKEGVVIRMDFGAKAELTDKIDDTLYENIEEAFTAQKFDVTKGLSKGECKTFDTGAYTNRLRYIKTGIYPVDTSLFIVKDAAQAEWSENAVQEDLSELKYLPHHWFCLIKSLVP